MPERWNAIEVRLHMRHVGLGNAIFLELPDDQCCVIDWGTTDKVHHQYLIDTLGDRDLAFVAATHGHEDHTAGLPWVFRTLIDLENGSSRIRRYFTPLAEELGYEPIKAVAETLSAFWKRYPKVGQKRGIEVSEPSFVDGNAPPVLLETENYRLLALHPPESIRSKAELMAAVGGRSSGNRTSLVLLLQLAGGEASILFGGDAEEPAWNTIQRVVDDWPEAEPIGPVTILSHHGASFSQGMPRWAIERWTQDGISLFSTPSADQYHPDPKTLQLVCETSSKVFCTSYAEVCGQAFAESPPPTAERIVRDQPCFGNMIVTLRADGSWEVEHDGPGLRERGYCMGT